MTALRDALASRLGTVSIAKEHKQTILQTLPKAREFVFSERASELMGRFAFECPDLLLGNWQFAIPPYDVTYVELDLRAFFKASPRAQDTGGSDVRVGYLVVDQLVFVASSGVDVSEGGVVCPFGFTVAGPGQQARRSNIQFRCELPEEEFKRATGWDSDTSDWFNLATALGTTLDYITEEQREVLVRSVQVQVLMEPSLWKKTHDNGMAAELLRSQSGDIRNLWTCLLWLNQPTQVRYIDVPASSKLVRGKRVAYAKHRVVEIDLANRSKTLRRVFKSLMPRESPRRHEVRGAFHHTGGDKDCGHEWPIMPDEKGHWHCSRCGRTRWWVKDHVRGDASKGFTTKEYTVGV